MRFQVGVKAIAVALALLTSSQLFQACKGNQESEDSSTSQALNLDTHNGVAPTASERRIALVVGNSRYRYVNYLNNPRNDARLIAKSLKSVGFKLVDGGPQLDLDKAAFDRAVQDFGNQLRGATIALFYYAGHGMQVNGVNYLVPVSANPTKESDVDFQMVDAQTILHQMEDGSARLNILILDACRNNPFGGRGIRAANGGLAQMQAPDGTLIFYATQPGAVATDGDGDDTPFTASLAEVIHKPGLDISRAFNEVALDVQNKTGRIQRPWLEQSAIEGDFYFVSATPVPTPALAAPALAGSVPDADVVFWMSIANSNDPKYLKSYLKEFPNGRFAELARLRLNLPQQSAPKPTALPAAPATPQAAASAPVQPQNNFKARMQGVMDRNGAEAMMSRLVQSGYEPHLVPTEIDHQTWYQIEIGPFATETEANAAKENLDKLESEQQLAISSRAPLHTPASIVPSPEDRHPAKTYTVQMEQVMDYSDAVSSIMRLAKLGYHPHLVPTTINGEQKYKIEVGPFANDQQAREAKKKLHHLSRQQQTLAALPPLDVTPASDATPVHQAQQIRRPYKIQVEDTTDHYDAELIMLRLRRLGYTPQLVQTNEEGQTRYHIEVGAFASEDEADAAAEELHQKYEVTYAPGSHAETIANDTDALGRKSSAMKNTVVAPNTTGADAGDEENQNQAVAKYQAGEEPNTNRYAAASFYNRGNTFLLANDQDEAIAQFRKAVELNPDNADALYGWGLALYRKRDLDAAIAKFRKTVAINPNYANAYYIWGLALYDQNNVDGAISKFEKAVELNSDYADAYYNYGLALSRKGDPDGAILKFQKATELNPNYADAYYGWGVALYHKHDLDGTITEYKKALELKPANEFYKRALASALAERNNAKAGAMESQK